MNSSTPSKSLLMASLLLDAVSAYVLCKRVASKARELRPASRHMHLK